MLRPRLVALPFALAGQLFRSTVHHILDKLRAESALAEGPKNSFHRIAGVGFLSAAALAAFGISQESGLNEKEIVLTRDGLKKLEVELDELKTVHRREVNERIRQAKEFGDISENAEYEDAKQEQAFVEGRILKLEGMIRNARIIDQSDYVADEVHLGATVRVKETKSGSAHEFTIVGSAEADPKNARLSNESPLGRALMGRKQGDIVDVTTPRGQMKYKIESINKAVKKTKKAS